ncbi:hypothetical protein N7G274_002526 [Stereocaulon virgatum]|uniref:Uncharacterized protein n=1 Tax=Stereocaulon virgatum TaxID=373712 RepID=A0ABR4AIR7_9LECA
MIDLLEARPVARVDLESQIPPHDDGDLDPTLEAQFRDQVERSYFPDSFATDTDHQDVLKGWDAAALGQPLQKDDEAYTFRLFARRKPSGPSDDEDRGLQKIVLGSPSPASGEPGFVNPERASAYYFTGTASAGQAEQYRKAAVSGEQLFQGLKTRWPGFELPWRVTSLDSTRRFTTPCSENLSFGITAKRKRSGKKRRISTRIKSTLRSAMESAARQVQAEKEAVYRDKRTRKNREKKLKRRQKDKLKKVQGVQGAQKST